MSKCISITDDFHYFLKSATGLYGDSISSFLQDAARAYCEIIERDTGNLTKKPEIYKAFRDFYGTKSLLVNEKIIAELSAMRTEMNVMKAEIDRKQDKI